MGQIRLKTGHGRGCVAKERFMLISFGTYAIVEFMSNDR